MNTRLIAILMAAALSGPARAGWEEAVNAYNNGDYASAAKEFRPFAEQGQATAQYILGWIFQNGEGVRQDYAESARWYAKAAEKGNPDAQYAIGSYFLYGTGVGRDTAQAAAWFRKSAEQGKAGGQYLLGYLLSQGDGVSRNDQEATSWYRKAADQGYADAQYAYALALSSGSGVERDESEANLWLRKAADQKHVESAFLLGWNSERGTGVLPDYAEAAKWYRQAADAGNPEAQYHLALLVRDGRGVPRNDPLALELFRKAAAAGQSSIPGAVDDYIKAGSFDNAFSLADTWLQKNPDDVQLLSLLSLAAAGQARSDPAKFAAPAKTYGDRAIAVIESGRRPSGLDDAQWAEYPSRWLPQLHLRLGMVAQKAGQLEDAQARFRKAATLDAKDPYPWYFLGQTHFTEYERINAGSRKLDGQAKSDAVGKAFAQLDRVIESYARALGLCEGKDALRELRDPLLQDLRKIYEFRNGSRNGFDELLARYRP